MPFISSYMYCITGEDEVLIADILVLYIIYMDER